MFQESGQDRPDPERNLSHRHLQLFIDHAPVALAMFDRSMRYLAASRRWLEDYGLRSLDILGRSHYDVFPEIGEHWKAVHRRGLDGDTVRADEDRFERIDGTVQWLRWEVRPWTDTDGAVGGILIFSEDITRQKEAEEDLRRLNAELERRVAARTSELAAVNFELDAFASAVSHELRSPLLVVSGFSHMLEETCGDVLRGEGLELVHEIRSAGKRMNGLIDGLLSLSRGSRHKLERASVDLSALARRLMEAKMRSEPEREVRWHVAPDLRAEGDPELLEVVMANLLRNAWKYTSRTPSAEIRVYAEEHEGRRWICVADNGAGFDERHAKRLFEPFRRLHRQDEFPGTGVGLATVARIVWRHGGEVAARGEVGQGATFRFTLPSVAMPQARRGA